VFAVLEPGSGGNVCVIDDLRTQERLILKSAFLDEPKKNAFVKLMDIWKSLSESKFIVKLKEFFFEESFSSLIIWNYSVIKFKLF
jgi:hypothetical protein